VSANLDTTIGNDGCPACWRRRAEREFERGSEDILIIEAINVIAIGRRGTAAGRECEDQCRCGQERNGPHSVLFILPGLNRLPFFKLRDKLENVEAADFASWEKGLAF